MRSIVFFFLVLTSFGTAQVTDNFTDGDFTVAPVWSGDVADFTVVGGQLRSNSSTASYGFHLSTPSTTATNAQWELYVNLQFPTSSANYTDIYLMSDSANLESTTNSGYFVRIGNTTDEISLYKRTSGTNLKIIDGLDGQTNLSNNLIKLKVTRDATNLWTLQRDLTGTGSSYFTEGSVIDAAITTSAYFGIFIQQSTATFHLKHFYDDIYVGPIILDVTAPTIVSSTVISSTQVDVLFDENVDLTTAQTLANYSADNGLGNPSVATRDATNLSLVHLTFATVFTNALLNTLTVINVQDLSANAITTATTSFTYIAPVVAAYRNIIINEIYADPSPVVGLPAIEFIELYNNSTNTFDLNGWKFTDGTSTGTLGSFILAPNQYVILCPMADTSLFSPFGNTLGLTTFPSLNNTGDNLHLLTDLLVPIDSVNYSDTWYQDAIKDDGGWTLELINPNAPTGCPIANNWIASSNAAGGTPGIQNSVYSTVADVTLPSIASITVVDSTHITVCFSEALDGSQIAVLANYSINNGIGNPVSALANSGLNCVDFVLATSLMSDSSYILSTTSLSDCSGNMLSPGIANFSYHIVQPFDIVINEIMADPDPVVTILPNNEYVEFYNTTAFPINLNNWKFSAGTNTKILPSIIVPADSFIVITSVTGLAGMPVGINAEALVSFPSLTNTGQILTLQSPQGMVISTVSYSDTWYQDVVKKEGGYSLEQIDPSNPCAGMDNWRASNSSNGGTPGVQNSIDASNPDNTPPQVVRVSVIATDTIQLYFNEPLDSASMMNPAIYTIDNSVGNPTLVHVIAPDYKSVRLTLGTTLSLGTIYTITVNNVITDCVGNPLGSDNSARFAIPEPAAAKDIVINEILFNPKTPGVDFVEIYNRSNKVIDLKTISISEFDTITNTILAPETISSDGYLIFPQEYILLSENGAIVQSQFTTTNPEGFLDLVNLPTMNDDGGTVCLSTATEIIDNFKYYDNMHFGLLNETEGISLERIDFERLTQDRTNWHSAAEAVGFATPAYKNSQYSDAGETESAIEITPEVFSPDEDGVADVVNINYHFDTPGFTANVIVYDSKGRIVKHLIQSELLGVKGTFSWDGINDDREKARIGIYIFYFEVFDLTGTVKHYKKTCVLAGKL